MPHHCHCKAFALETPTAARVLTTGPGEQEYHSPSWCAYIRRRPAPKSRRKSIPNGWGGFRVILVAEPAPVTFESLGA